MADISQNVKAGLVSKNFHRPEMLTYRGECKFCPLCQSHICLYFMNFHDKLAMCENVECDFPFGFVKPIVLKPGEKLEDEKVETYGVSTTIQRSSKEITTEDETGKSFPETDKVGKISNVDKPSSKDRSMKKLKKQTTEKEPVKEEEKILKTIEGIKEMHIELLTLNEELSKEKEKEEECRSIRNEKWIKNLRNLQAMSGVQLLRPEEMGLLNKEQPEIGLGELKIDIGSGNVSTVPSIRIEIHNTDPAEPVRSDKPEGKGPIVHVKL